MILRVLYRELVIVIDLAKSETINPEVLAKVNCDSDIRILDGISLLLERNQPVIRQHENSYVGVISTADGGI